MKLSELVRIKNNLDNVSSIPIRNDSEHKLTEITHVFDNYLPVHAPGMNALKDNIAKSYNVFEHELNTAKALIKDQISVAEKPWFQESYELYEGELKSEASTLLALRSGRDINIDFYRSRINLSADWHYPAMIIRPSNSNLIDDMVAYDPLYLVDLSHDFLEPAVSKFNEQYQSRLRKYTIRDDDDQPILGKIPDGQLGMCLAYNYFNFRPLDVLKKYLTEIYTKLRPGGVLAMTFNDCDRITAVELVESYYCCYTPGYLVRDLATNIGYDIAFDWHDSGPTTWLELRKPGQLASLKGGQTLAKIVEKSK